MIMDSWTLCRDLSMTNAHCRLWPTGLMEHSSPSLEQCTTRRDFWNQTIASAYHVDILS